jgi:hypothetical protein
MHRLELGAKGGDAWINEQLESDEDIKKEVCPLTFNPQVDQDLRRVRMRTQAHAYFT